MNPFSPRILVKAGRLPALIAAAFALICLAVAPAASGAARNTVEDVEISQVARLLIVKVQTGRQVALRKLNRQPDFLSRSARYLCLGLGRAGRRTTTRICVGGARNSHHRLGVSRVAANGRTFARSTIEARIRRTGKYRLTISFEPGRAGLAPGRWRWRASIADGSCENGDRDCASHFPPGRHGVYRVRPIRAVGCSGGNGQVVRNGPRRGKRVALTFDDGPGPDTPAVLRKLRRFKVRATFFMLGMQVNLYPDLARKVLANGHEVANHSSVHALLPGYGDIMKATGAITRTTGFRPCLFRPPYGATSSGLISAVRRAKMKSVIWDVDTVDWSRPGSGTIRSRITGGVRPGSIVLMHDAGGPRGQTVEALPGAIRNLKRRGYRFVTVSELLGNRIRYRPAG